MATENVREELDRRDATAKQHKQRITVLVIALIPLFGGGGAWASALISKNARLEADTVTERQRAENTRLMVDKNRKGIVYNRLLTLKVGRDISAQIAEAHGRPVQPLPTVEAELTKALAEMAAR